MNNKTKGTIAGAAAIALLASGTTFALWNQTASVAGGTITSGNLAVSSNGAGTWVDLSTDRTDAGHTIDDLSTFKIVPGDTIQGTFGLKAALEGDNMVAELGLTLSGAEAAGTLLADPKVTTITYSLLDSTGAPVEGATDIALGAPAKVAFASADNSNNDAALPTLPAVLTDPAAAYTVQVNVEFKASTTARDRVQAQANLSNLGVTLNQTRAAATGGGF